MAIRRRDGKRKACRSVVSVTGVSDGDVGH